MGFMKPKMPPPPPPPPPAPAVPDPVVPESAVRPSEVQKLERKEKDPKRVSQRKTIKTEQRAGMLVDDGSAVQYTSLLGGKKKS